MNTLAGRIVTLCWITFYAVWIVAAFSAKRTAVRQARWGRWWPLLTAVVVLLLVRRQTAGLFRLAVWSITPAIGLAADVVTLAGLGVALWARATLGGLWSPGVVLKEDHAIVDRGPYRIVRHPIYSGVLLMMLGTVVLVGRLLAVVLFAVAFSGLCVKARLEERLLGEHLADEYRAYRQRVRSALIPGVL